jgi:carbon monoxide dehydrogenase subunit G
VIISNALPLRVPPEDAYRLLLDLDQIAPCIPGATLEPPDGSDTRHGTVLVRFGPMRFNYAGSVRVIETDALTRKAVLEAHGKESSGEGNANARITMSVQAADNGCQVAIETDLELSGAAAQLGRAMVEDFAEVMLDDFAKCLLGRLEPTEETGSNPDVRSAIEPRRDASATRLLWKVLVTRLRRLFSRSPRRP